MDSSSIAVLTMGWQDKIPKNSHILIQEKLKDISDDKMSTLGSLRLKNPTLGLIFGLFLNAFGADRFYKGDFLMAGIKSGLFASYIFLSILAMVTNTPSLIVLGLIFALVFFAWSFLDFFLVWRGIKRDNLTRIQKAIHAL